MNWGGVPVCVVHDRRAPEGDEMLLTLTTTHQPATDLGFLLHKNPSRVHSGELSFGNAHLVLSEATEERCR